MGHVNVPCTCAHEVVDPSRSLLKTFVPASFPRKLEHGVDADAHPEVAKQDANSSGSKVVFQASFSDLQNLVLIKA